METLPSKTQQEFQCPHCENILTEPTLIKGCGHFVCATCLDQLWSKKAVTCPTCKARTRMLTKPEPCVAMTVAVQIFKSSLQHQSDELQNAVTQPNDSSFDSGEECFSCSHLAASRKTPASTCSHCNQKFCQYCELKHIEKMKTDVLKSIEQTQHVSVSDMDRAVGNAKSILKRLGSETKRNINSGIDRLSNMIQKEFDRLKMSQVQTVDALTNSESWKYDQALCEVKKSRNELAQASKKLQTTSVLNLRAEDLAQIENLSEKCSRQQEQMGSCVAEASSKRIVIPDVFSDFERLANEIVRTDPEVKLHSLSEIQEMVESTVVPEMHLSAREGRLKTFNTVDKVTINHQDPNDENRTVLHQAVRGSHLDIVEVLLGRLQADPTVRDRNGFLPVHYAAEQSNMHIFEYLLEASRTVINGEDKDDSLQILVRKTFQNQDCNFFRALLDFDGSLTLRSFQGGRLLHETVRMGSLECLQVLVGRGVDLEEEDDLGNTALDLASELEKDDICTYLLEVQPDLSFSNA